MCIPCAGFRVHSFLRKLLFISLFIFNMIVPFFPGSDHLRAVFGHMGLGDKEIVALSGAHTLVSVS